MSLPDRDAPRLELLDVRAADRVGALLVELVGIDAPHVVGLENRGIQHKADAMSEARPRDGVRTLTWCAAT